MGDSTSISDRFTKPFSPTQTLSDALTVNHNASKQGGPVPDMTKYDRDDRRTQTSADTAYAHLFEDLCHALPARLDLVYTLDEMVGARILEAEATGYKAGLLAFGDNVVAIRRQARQPSEFSSS